MRVASIPWYSNLCNTNDLRLRILPDGGGDSIGIGNVEPSFSLGVCPLENGTVSAGWLESAGP